MTYMFQNFLFLFRKIPYIIGFFILSISLSIIWYFTTDFWFLIGNNGLMSAYLDITLSLIMIGIFPIFLLWILYKSLLFGRKNSHKKNIIWGIGWMIGTILSWCTCCSASLITYLWLTGFIVQFPIIEHNLLLIKGIWTLLMILACIDVLKNLQSCKMQK